MEELKLNINEIYTELPSNFQVSADNGYSTDINTEYLEQEGLDGYISSRKLSIETKKYNKLEKPFSKDNFTYNSELGTYFCPLGEPLYRRREYEYKRSRILHKKPKI